MSLTGRFLDFPCTEALFFLPLSFIHRFVGRDGQEAALTAPFDTDRWRKAIPLGGSSAASSSSVCSRNNFARRERATT